MQYTLKRSKRKTLALQVTKDLEVVVRAPMRASTRDIERMVLEHTGWIERQQETMRQRQTLEPDATALMELRRMALAYIPPRVALFSARMGLMPTAVKITQAKTRFGSCSAKNSLCFSCRLMCYPPEAIDYVVVHELAHIAHKDHGKAFYARVESILPDYKARRALLKK